jgi:hypothetical protein
MKTSDPGPDLSKAFPRSPRETLAGFVIAARTLDKCRATLAGTNGEYKFDCSLDRVFFDFAGIKADDFKEFVATGATDEAVADWIKSKARDMDDSDRIAWNNQLRGMRLADMPADRQLFLEDYISRNLPAFPPVYVWFDVYDIEEKRMR